MGRTGNFDLQFFGGGGSPTQEPNFIFRDFDPNYWQRAVSNSDSISDYYGVRPYSDPANVAASLISNPNSPIYTPNDLDGSRELQQAQTYQPTITQQQSQPRQSQGYYNPSFDLNQILGIQGSNTPAPQQMQPAPPVQQVQQQPVQRQQPVQPIQPAPVQQQQRQAPIRVNNSNVMNEGIGMTFNWEGTRVNVNKKTGLRSRYGITNVTLDDAIKKGIVRPTTVEKLTPDEAKKIYWKKYWYPSKADKLPTALGIIYCDTVYNGGGGEVLNKALNRYVGRKIVKENGTASQQAINTINSLLTDDDKLHRFINIFCDVRAARYRTLKNAPTNLKGWLRRNEDFRRWAI